MPRKLDFFHGLLGPSNIAGAAARPRSRLREYAEAVLVAVVFALFVRTFLFQAFAVPTPSMEKTVLVGDHLLVNKFVYAPHVLPLVSHLLPYRDVRRGDILVFKFPEDPRRDFIKRVVALPGDSVELRDKAFFVNGVMRREPKTFHSDDRVFGNEADLPDEHRLRDQYGPLKVAPDSYFALGDNRDVSRDSRFWGPVPGDNLKGRALFVYWSLAPKEAPAGNLIGRALGLFSRTRWNRTFAPVE